MTETTTTTIDPIVTAYKAYHRSLGLAGGGAEQEGVEQAATPAYPAPLPGPLASHYIYIEGFGHAVLALAPGNAAKFEAYVGYGELHTLCVAVPVRSALRGYTLFRGHPVVDCLTYSDATGYINAFEDEDKEM